MFPVVHVCYSLQKPRLFWHLHLCLIHIHLWFINLLLLAYFFDRSNMGYILCRLTMADLFLLFHFFLHLRILSMCVEINLLDDDLLTLDLTLSKLVLLLQFYSFNYRVTSLATHQITDESLLIFRAKVLEHEVVADLGLFRL